MSKHFRKFHVIYLWLGKHDALCDQNMCGVTTTLCHSQQNGLCGEVVWVDLGQLVYYVAPPPNVEKNKLFLNECLGILMHKSYI